MCALETGRTALRRIDWSAPWLSHWAEQGPGLSQALAAGQDLPSALNNHLQAPVRFVRQSDMPSGHAYESFIGQTATVPTREGLHDAFNALCWHQWPRSKQRLNHLQVAEIERLGIGAVRGPVRDTLTLVDENAVFLQAPDALWRALLARNWHQLFLDGRSLWAQARLGVLGHALLEKLHQPYKGITAHVWAVPVPVALGQDWAAWDDWVAHTLTPERLASKPLTPLPVLGIPGWWSANADPAFYADPHVFRAPRPPAGS